ncbi:MAG: hypothetical protein FWD69_04370 [Polyangiaceae bacterium]|nr:hypothetical protein [Polyangiaceae bacterium]
MRSLDGVVDRPARFQLIVALVLGLVLVVIPLYLWRRPRVQLASATTTESSNTAAVPTTIPSIAAPSVEGGMEPKVALSDVKIVACQDSGAKKIPPEQCDRVVELEKLFTKAISESAACIPKDAGGGTIIYVLDMNFKKKFFSIHTPKEGRTFKNAALVGGCQIGVKAKLRTLSDDPFVHQHHHYKLSVTAVYPGSIKP